MPLPDGTLTPEEYAAQIAGSLSQGQDAPGLTPAAELPPSPVAPPVPLTLQQMADQARTQAGLPVYQPPAPVETQEEVDPMLGVVQRPVSKPAAAPPAATRPPVEQAAGLDLWGQQPARAGQGAAVAGAMTMPTFGMGNTIANAREQQAAVTAEGDAASRAAQAQADAQAKAMEREQQLQNFQTQQRAAMQADIDGVVKDYSGAKIDPHRLWNSRSGGEQAMSLVGIILAGVGSGLTGQPNVALQVIDKAIERDINAQTASMEKKGNLVGMMYRKYGNLQQAQDMARATQASIIAHDLQRQAAASGSAQAIAHAKAVSAQIMAPVAQMMDQYANQRAMYAMYAQQGGGTRQYANADDAARPAGIPGTPEFFKSMEEARRDNISRELPPVGGKQWIAKDAPTAKTVMPRVIGLNSLKQALERVEQYRSQGRPVDYNAAMNAVGTEYARALGMDVSPASVEKAKEIMPGKVRGYLQGQESFGVVRDSINDLTGSIYEAATGRPAPRTKEY